MVLLVQADFDGELDAAQAAAMATHRAGCAVCRGGLCRAEAHPRRVARPAISIGPRPRRCAGCSPRGTRRGRRPPRRGRRIAWWRRPAASFGLGAAVAAALAVLILAPRTAGHDRRGRREPHARAAARPSRGCRLHRPAHGEAVVRRPARFRAAGEGSQG